MAKVLKLEKMVLSYKMVFEDFLAKQPSLTSQFCDDHNKTPHWSLYVHPRGSAKLGYQFAVELVNVGLCPSNTVVDYTLACLNDDETPIRSWSGSMEFSVNQGRIKVIWTASNDQIPLSRSGRLIIQVDITIPGKIPLLPRKIPYEIPKGSLNGDWLIKLLRSGMHSDFTIESADGQTFPVHKGILAARNPTFFASLVSIGMQEAKDNRVKLEFDTEVVSALLEFLYSEDVANLSSSAAVRLYPAAHQYESARLVAICGKIISENLTIANISVAIRIAKLFDDAKLQSACEQFVDVHKSDAFLMLLAAACSDD